MAALARDAIVEYWTTDGHSATSAAGVKMIEPTFMAAWNWDARPFPAFPRLGLWGDAPNWPAGTWIGGKGPAFPPAGADAPPLPSLLPSFPVLAGRGWSVVYRPIFVTDVTSHASGKESRAGRVSMQRWEIALTFDALSDAVSRDIEAIGGFYAGRSGGALPFLMPVTADLGQGATLPCRFIEDQLDAEEFMRTIVSVRSLTLRSVAA